MAATNVRVCSTHVTQAAGRVYVYGGWTLDDGAFTLLDTVEVMIPEQTGEWQRLDAPMFATAWNFASVPLP